MNTYCITSEKNRWITVKNQTELTHWHKSFAESCAHIYLGSSCKSQLISSCIFATLQSSYLCLLLLTDRKFCSIPLALLLKLFNYSSLWATKGWTPKPVQGGMKKQHVEAVWGQGPWDKEETEGKESRSYFPLRWCQTSVSVKL